MEGLADLQRELDRLALSSSDLTLAAQCCQYLRKRDLLASPVLTLDHGDGLLAVALQHALIVSYCRPFTQRKDRAGNRETEDYLAAARASFSPEQTQLEARLLELRDQVVGHSDASASQTSIQANREDPYVVHAWGGRRPLRPEDLLVVEEMIHKLRYPLEKRLSEVKSALVEARKAEGG